MNKPGVKAPWHLWFVAIITVLWNAMGAFDYLATRLRLESYMSQFTAEQLEYFYSFPVWVTAAWAVAVWSGLLGSISLLIRRAWAVPLFAASIAGMLVTSLHNFVLSEGAEMMGEGALAFTAVIWFIAIGLLFYARSMAKRDVLR